MDKQADRIKVEWLQQIIKIIFLPADIPLSLCQPIFVAQNNNVPKNETETFCPKSRKQWRQWLQKYHSTKESVWLMQYKKHSNLPSLSWSEAVEEALCFGWIDSIRKTVDEERFIQFFSRRKPTSVWSKINKAKIERLISEGSMMEAGHKSIAVAKQNGSWTILDDVETLKKPADLQKQLKAAKGAKQFFDSLSKSSQKAILQWLVLAKRPETRQKRITEIATLAAQQLKPKQFR